MLLFQNKKYQLISFIIIVLFFPLIVNSASACSVFNPSTRKSFTSIQSAINAVTTFGDVTLNVSGTCSDNLYVPNQRSIILAGQLTNQGAILQPKDTSSSAAYVLGRLIFRNMTVQSSAGTPYALLQAEYGGTLSVYGSRVTSSTARNLVAATNNSQLFVVNSKITTTGTEQRAALEIDASSVLRIYGDSAQLAGPDGSNTTVTTDDIATGANCFFGGSIIIEAQGTGTVLFTDNQHGIKSNQCSVALYNNTTSVSGITITKNVKDALMLTTSDAFISNATISNNVRFGLNLFTSNARVYGTTFTSNTSADIWSGFKSYANLDGPGDFGKNNNFTTLNGGSFNCYADGRIDYEKDGVQQNLTSYESPVCLRMYDLN